MSKIVILREVYSLYGKSKDLSAISIMQGGYVLAKTHKPRVVSIEVHEAIRYLKDNPPNPNKIFMYREGNYRLFPVGHEWYLGYRLREFW